MFPHHDFIAVRVIGGRFVTRFQMPPVKPEEQTFHQHLRTVHLPPCGPDESVGWADYRRKKLEDAQ